MSGKKSKKITYSEEFKKHAVREALNTSVSQTSKKLNVSRPALTKWMKQPWAKEIKTDTATVQKVNKELEAITESFPAVVESGDQEAIEGEVISTVAEIKQTALNKLSGMISSVTDPDRLAEIIRKLHWVEINQSDKKEKSDKDYWKMIEQKINKTKD